MRKNLIFWLFLSLAPALSCAAGGSALQEQPAVSAADGRAVRAVIEAQLKALSAGDAARAFSYAAPAIKAQLHDATTFIGMVTSAYPMLVHPAAVSFFAPEAREGVVLQSVLFRDQRGHLWHAIYQVERQADNAWLIAGCGVQPEADSSTT